MLRTLALFALLFLSAASPRAARAQEWLLWPSPFGGAEVVDQKQEVDQVGNFNVQPRPNRGVGQTFVPRAGHLSRLDFKVKNNNDTRPGRVDLWKWRGSYADTVASEPIFSDTVELSGRTGWQIRSIFPRMDVESGTVYFVEFSAPQRGPYSLKGNHDGSDRYPDGEARYNGAFQPTRSKDLWFRSFGPPRGEPRVPAFSASDPELPWSEPLAPAPVSRSDYFERVKAYAERLLPSALACSEQCQLVAELPAFLYRVSCLEAICDESHARTALAILRRAHAWRFCGDLDESDPTPCDSEKRKPWPWPQRTGIAWRWLSESPSLRDGDETAVRALLADGAAQLWEKRELGSFNRALVSANGLATVAALFPDLPEAEAWRVYGEQVWNEFWRHHDTWEDSGSYNDNVWWPEVLGYAEVSGRADTIWQDAGFRALVDRFFQHTAPLGVDPHYGDGAGWAHELAPLIWLYERAAVATGEPRYRWLARRVFDYKRSHTRDDPPRRDSLNRKMLSLARAYLDARDEPAGAPPTDAGSHVTTRLRARARLPSQWGSPRQYYDFGDDRVGDKLVFRSGFEASDLHAVFNLLGGYGHGHVELGALASLTDRGSLLLDATPYPHPHGVRAAQDESAPLVRRYWGGSYGGVVNEAEVDRFEDHHNASVAWLRWRDPHGWNVGVERRFLFVKNRFLWVRDRFTFPDDIQAAVGPVWHAADLHPRHGDHWYVAYDREPTGNVWKYRNPERYALLYFVPRPDADVTAFEAPIYLPPEGCPNPSPEDVVSPECRSSPPFVVYQKWTGAAHPGDERWFDTLVRPFGPDRSPEQAADGVRVLAAGAHSVALRVEMGDETWFLVDNPEGDAIETPELSTDARSLLLRVREGSREYLLVRDATRVEAGLLSLRWPGPVSLEQGPFDPAGSRPEPE